MHKISEPQTGIEQLTVGPQNIPTWISVTPFDGVQKFSNFPQKPKKQIKTI